MAFKDVVLDLVTQTKAAKLQAEAVVFDALLSQIEATPADPSGSDEVDALRAQVADLTVQLSASNQAKDALAAQVGDLQSQLEAKSTLLASVDAQAKAIDASIPDA